MLTSAVCSTPQLQTGETEQVSVAQTEPRPSVFLVAIFWCDGLRASDSSD